MPKIIDNLEVRLRETARQQARDGGYAAVTIRSVAAACGVGVGTVYNYYSSKDALLAAFLLDDWKACLLAVEAVKAAEETPGPVLRETYRQLKRYLQLHRAIFRDPAAVRAINNVISRYHGILRDQLAQPLMSFCEEPFRAQFLAEALLTWTVAGRTEEELLPLLEKLL